MSHFTPQKREQMVIYRFLRPLGSTKNFMKTTSLIDVHLVVICYHLQWLMLAPFRVSNAFYLTLICQLLHIVLVFSNL